MMHSDKYRQQMRQHLKTAYNLTDEKIDAMLPRFLEMLTIHVCKLEELIRNDNIEALGRAGHSMKGALLNLGLHELAQQAYIIEQRCKTTSDTADCAHLIKELKQKINIFA